MTQDDVSADGKPSPPKRREADVPIRDARTGKRVLEDDDVVTLGKPPSSAPPEQEESAASASASPLPVDPPKGQGGVHVRRHIAEDLGSTEPPPPPPSRPRQETSFGGEPLKRDLGIAYLLLFMFGLLGAHRFYLDEDFRWVYILCQIGVALSFVMGISTNETDYIFGGLALIGFTCVGWLIDLADLPQMVRKANEREAKRGQSS